MQALVLQREDCDWSWSQLQLEALAGGRHVGDAATHFLQQLQLLLVRVIEGPRGSSARSRALFAFARKIIPIRFMTPLMGFARPLLTDPADGQGPGTATQPTVRVLHLLPHCSGADALITDDCVPTRPA